MSSCCAASAVGPAMQQQGGGSMPRTTSCVTGWLPVGCSPASQATLPSSLRHSASALSVFAACCSSNDSGGNGSGVTAIAAICLSPRPAAERSSRGGALKLPQQEPPLRAAGSNRDPVSCFATPGAAVAAAEAAGLAGPAAAVEAAPWAATAATAAGATGRCDDADDDDPGAVSSPFSSAALQQQLSEAMHAGTGLRWSVSALQVPLLAPGASQLPPPLPAAQQPQPGTPAPASTASAPVPRARSLSSKPTAVSGSKRTLSGTPYSAAAAAMAFVLHSQGGPGGTVVTAAAAVPARGAAAGEPSGSVGGRRQQSRPLLRRVRRVVRDLCRMASEAAAARGPTNGRGATRCSRKLL